MGKVNKVILDGSNEDASKRLDEMIKNLKKEIIEYAKSK